METVEHVAQIKSIALKSDCGNFRFVLSRIWNSEMPVGAFLCANPSKADELRYDDTVFKCGNMAANWGWGGFHILNLYPNYSTDPSEVLHDKEADLLNAQQVAKFLAQAHMVILACGNDHDEKLTKLIQGVPKNKLYCLRRNKGGGFQHPARVKPEDYKSPVQAFGAEA